MNIRKRSFANWRTFSRLEPPGTHRSANGRHQLCSDSSGPGTKSANCSGPVELFFWEIVSVNSEMTDITNSRWTGRVLYDGDCALCIGLARKFRRPLLRRGFILDPLSNRDLSAAEEMIVEFRNGGRFGGADALVALARHVW